GDRARAPGGHSRLPDHQSDLGADLPEDRRRGVRHRRLDEPRRDRRARGRTARGRWHRDRPPAHQEWPAHPRGRRPRRGHDPLVARHHMSGGGHIAWFEEIGLGDREQVGGKGGSRGELQRAGSAVPPGFVVRTGAFERFLAALEREAPVRAALTGLDPDDLAALTARSKTVRRRFEAAELPAEVRDELYAAHHALVRGNAEPPVAGRSSATCEDAADASFAGLQDTYLWVRGAQQTLQRVRSCWASLYSVESISYRLKHRFPEERVAMAVVVQIMVDARTAGVMFTRSPTTGDRSVVTIEGAWGLGSAVVGGEVTPDRWVLGKITGEISVREIADKLIQHVPLATGGVEA